jgi:hypothetical protein
MKISLNKSCVVYLDYPPSKKVFRLFFGRWIKGNANGQEEKKEVTSQ